MRKGRGLALVTVVFGMTVGAMAPELPASAEANRSVLAAGSASGSRISYSVPDAFLTSEVIDAGGPVAEAVVDSTGRAQSFASLPWPGANAIAFPGTLAAALQQPFPAAYPFFVGADYPTVPSSELTEPTGSYSLRASATARTAKAAGEVTGQALGSSSRATVDNVVEPDGAVRVVAESIDAALSFGDGALRIGRIVSRSETRLGPADTTPSTTASLVIEGASVRGEMVTIDAEGIHIGRGSTPVPTALPSVDETLRRAGLTVEVLPGTHFDGGSTTDALVVSAKHPVPGSPDATIRWRLGGTRSEIALSVPTPVDTPTTDVDGVSGSDGVSAGPADASTGGAGGDPMNLALPVGSTVRAPAPLQQASSELPLAEVPTSDGPGANASSGALGGPGGPSPDSTVRALALARLSGRAVIPLAVMAVGAVTLLLSTRRYPRKGTAPR